MSIYKNYYLLNKGLINHMILIQKSLILFDLQMMPILN
jgi:hypothetical protein